MAIIWIVCQTCKGARRWIVNGQMVICTACNGTGGENVIV